MINAYIDKDKNVIIIPSIETVYGFYIAIEPWKVISAADWNTIPSSIKENVNMLSLLPITNKDEHSSTVFKDHGVKNFKKFSKNHICVGIEYYVDEKKYFIYNMPRFSNGGYGFENEKTGEPVKKHTCLDNENDIYDTFMLAYNYGGL